MVLLAAGFSRASRANQAFIRGGVARGLSGNAIARELRAAGRGVGRQDLQLAVRHFTGRNDVGRYIRALPQGSLTDPARLSRSRGFMRRDFAYTVGFDTRDKDGNRIKKELRITSDRVLSRQEIMDEFNMLAEEVLEDKENYDIEEIENANVTGGFRRA